MGKSDAAIGMLKRQGYVTVRVPRTDLRPLQVFAKNGNNLEFRGDLSDLLVSSGVSLPKIEDDETMANFNGQRSSDQKIGVGISLLGGIIGALGGTKLGLDTKFGTARTAQFEFQNVIGNKVNIFKLEAYVSAADVNTALPSSSKLLEDDKLYIVTSIVKTNKFGFVTKDSNNQELSVNIPIIKEVVGGSVSVGRSSTNNNVVTFEGEQKLVFGIQAVRMIYDNGEFSMFKSVDPGSVAAFSVNDINETGDEGETPGVAEVEPLTTNGPFIGLSSGF